MQAGCRYGDDARLVVNFDLGSMDGKLSHAHREGRLLDRRLVDRAWRTDK